jgi:hypothetical protein
LALFLGPVSQAITLDLPEEGATFDKTDGIEFDGTIQAMASGTADFGSFGYDGTDYTYNQEKEVGPILTGNGRWHLLVMAAPPSGWIPGDANHYGRLESSFGGEAVHYFITVNP